MSLLDTASPPPHTHGPGRRAWRRLLRNRVAVAALAVMILIVSLSLFLPLLSPHGYDEMDYTAQYAPVSAAHWFGADSHGRDMLTRCFIGARVSLIVGVAASLIALAIGLTYGSISGYLGGKTDLIMMRLVDIFYGIPYLLVVIMLMVIFQPGLGVILLAIGLTFWLKMARIVRGQALQVRENDYVIAARALGAGHARVILRHLLPNMIGPIIVTLTLSAPEAIFAEAFLSLIGLGVSEPQASLGALVSEGFEAIQYHPHLFFFPAGLITLIMLCFNFLGDGLRDALDPDQRDRAAPRPLPQSPARVDSHPAGRQESPSTHKETGP